MRVVGVTVDESLILQENGLGGRRRFGCGIFAPMRMKRIRQRAGGVREPITREVEENRTRGKKPPSAHRTFFRRRIALWSLR